MLKSYGPWSHVSCIAFCFSFIMSPFPGFSSLEEGGSLLFALFLFQALCCNVLMLFPRREHGNSYPQQMLLGAPGLRGQEALKWKNVPVVASFLSVFLRPLKWIHLEVSVLYSSCLVKLISFKVLWLLLRMQVIWYLYVSIPKFGWSLCPIALQLYIYIAAPYCASQCCCFPVGILPLTGFTDFRSALLIKY